MGGMLDWVRQAFGNRSSFDAHIAEEIDIKREQTLKMQNHNE